MAKYTSEQPQDPLELLAEEGLEIAHERMKAQRFGWEGTPEWVAAGKGTPRERFVQEVGDLLAVLEHAVIQRRLTPVEVMAAKHQKHRRLRELFDWELPVGDLVTVTSARVAAERFDALEPQKAVLDTPRMLLRQAVDRWPQFDADPQDADACSVNGGDMVEWFGEWRQMAKKVLKR